MKKLFSVIIILLMLCMNSCSSQTHIKNTIEDSLRKRYGIEIEFIDFRDERLNRNQYYFIAALKNNPKLIFGGSYDLGNNTIGDSYKQMKLHYEATQDVRSFLKPYFDHFVVGAEIYPYGVENDDAYDYKKILKYFPDSSEFVVRLYLPKSISDTDEQKTLKGIQALSSFLKDKHIQKIVIFADFFDEEYFKQVNISNEVFCFNEVTHHCFEYKTNYEYRNHIKQHLRLNIEKEDSVPSIDWIYSEIKPGTNY